MNNRERTVYIISDDNRPISISVGELLYSKLKLGITYRMFSTYEECLAECNNDESTL